MLRHASEKKNPICIYSHLYSSFQYSCLYILMSVEWTAPPPARTAAAAAPGRDICVGGSVFNKWSPEIKYECKACFQWKIYSNYWLKYSLITPRPPNDDVIPIINICAHHFDEDRKNIIILLILNTAGKIYTKIIYPCVISTRMNYIYGFIYMIER